MDQGIKQKIAKSWGTKCRTLLDEWVIKIDLLNKIYEIDDHSKSMLIILILRSIPLPILYLGNPIPSNPYVEGTHNKYPYDPKKAEANNPRFGVVFLLETKSVNSQTREKERGIGVVKK